MARGLWKGAISFGLVNVPVELHSARSGNSSRAAGLDMIMDRCPAIEWPRLGLGN